MIRIFTIHEHASPNPAQVERVVVRPRRLVPKRLDKAAHQLIELCPSGV
jgi:hypothetical protein